MKLKYFALAMACAMVLALAGCSANRDVNSGAPVQPTNSASAGESGRPGPEAGGGQNSPDVGGDMQNSAGVGDSGRARSGAGNVMDDIGDAAGDLARGAGNAARDVGDAIGDAVNGAGRAVR